MGGSTTVSSASATRCDARRHELRIRAAAAETPRCQGLCGAPASLGTDERGRDVLAPCAERSRRPWLLRDGPVQAALLIRRFTTGASVAAAAAAAVGIEVICHSDLRHATSSSAPAAIARSIRRCRTGITCHDSATPHGLARPRIGRCAAGHPGGWHPSGPRLSIRPLSPTCDTKAESPPPQGGRGHRLSIM